MTRTAGDVIRAYEPEDRFEFGTFSRPIQAAAFDKISRSVFSC